jgi:hypothetical protein
MVGQRNVRKQIMQLWEYGYFVVQELDNVYTKLWDSRGT